MKPTIGRIVHVFVPAATHPTVTDIAPAIITRVGVLEQRVPGAPTQHMGQLVNLCVFRDGSDPYHLTSVPLHADQAEAEAAHAECMGYLPESERIRQPVPQRAFWPPRDTTETFREVSKAQMAFAARNL